MEVLGSSSVESPQFVPEEGRAMPIWIVTHLEDAMGCMHALHLFLLTQEVQKEEVRLQAKDSMEVDKALQ